MPAFFLSIILFSGFSTQSAINGNKFNKEITSGNFFAAEDTLDTEDYLDSLLNAEKSDTSVKDSVLQPFPTYKDEGSSTLPVAIGVAAFLYLFNPIILFENDKIAFGFTKELSLGYGDFGQHRVSFEYSYIFRRDLNSIIRLGYKYDMLMKKGIQPSNLLQGTPALTVGGGYFHNFSRPGYFAESSYGYSIRNDKILFYPSIKLRYTYVIKGSNIIDLSFGLIIGIANPFIDLKIRRKR
ncbi:MAG: hypothetical protein M3P82_01105 [Bacteroidota bacterium]|nr:hypothetical protein [Bacteroidota bacterium]